MKTRKRGRTLLLTDTPRKQTLEANTAQEKETAAEVVDQKKKTQMKSSAAESSNSEPEEEMPVLTD